MSKFDGTGDTGITKGRDAPTHFDRQALNDCFLHDKDRLPHFEAIRILCDNLPPIAGMETIPLEQALGRILAFDLHAGRDIPSTDNSAVDGYAFAFADHSTSSGKFEIVATIAAGDTSLYRLEPGEAARILTGAIMPEGADTIAMQEDCRVLGKTVMIPQGLKPGANRRRAGEDVNKGQLVTAAGTRLRPQDLAGIAATGKSEVSVHKHLSVTLFSSGNELVEPGKEARRGEVHDANRTMLKALLSSLPVTITDGGILPDSAEAVEAALLAASGQSDIILTSAGASRGEEDHMVTTLDKHGTRKMWQLAIKPGRPMTFGTLGESVWFGLPGNPVASFICFLLYVRPSIIRLGGGPWEEPARFMVPATFDIPSKKPDRREFLRGMLITDEKGQQRVKKFPRDGSGLISGLRAANGLIELPEETTSINKGDPVRFIPFAEFGIGK